MGKKQDYAYIEYLDSSEESFSEVIISYLAQDSALIIQDTEGSDGYFWIPYGSIKKMWVQSEPFDNDEE